MAMTSDTVIKDAQKQSDKLGETFIKNFYWLLQTAKIHQDNNKVLRECAVRFMNSVVQICLDEPHMSVQISAGRFYVGEEKLKYGVESVELVRTVLQFFERCDLQGLCLYPTLGDAPIEQILAFAHMLNLAESQDNPFEWIVQQIADQDFSWSEAIHSPETPQKDPGLEEKARRTYFYALTSVKEIGRKISSNQPVGIRMAKRMVQSLVDVLSEDESLLLGISTIRDLDDYTYTHSVNVAILSLCMGKRLGLLQRSLECLGLCGLLHDLGKAEVPLEILLKPGKLNKQELEKIKKHPLKSVNHIVRLSTDRDLKAEIIPPVFQHHLRYNISGYPRPYRARPQGLFGRILAITDVFDAITSARIYRFTPYSPDKALNIMSEGAGKEFDPLLLKVFINMLGVFPVGTALKLDTGEMGLVMKTSGEDLYERPRILILVSDGNGGFRKGKTVSLSERDPSTGRFRRNIVKTFHPSTYGIQPAEFLL